MSLSICCYNKNNTKQKGDQTMKYPTRLSDAVHILAFIALYPDCDLTIQKQRNKECKKSR